MTKLAPISEIPGLVATGCIQHPLVVVALYQFDLLRRGEKR